MKNKFIILLLLLSANLFSYEIGFIILNGGKKLSCSSIEVTSNKNLKFIINKENKVWEIGPGSYEYAQLNQPPKEINEITILLMDKKFKQALSKVNEAEKKYANLGLNSLIFKLKTEIYFAQNINTKAFNYLNKILNLAKKNDKELCLDRSLMYTQSSFWDHGKFQKAYECSVLLTKSSSLSGRIFGLYTLADYYLLNHNITKAKKCYLLAYLAIDKEVIKNEIYVNCLKKFIICLKKENINYSNYLNELKEFGEKNNEYKKEIKQFIDKISEAKEQKDL
ncbi:hypothetical protein AAEX28_00460 [Lentisphaerota bacterium WC36G]|nr:hypothetical protein LJT99_03340 [Lentisphaerae bacterium WC36]